MLPPCCLLIGTLHQRTLCLAMGELQGFRVHILIQAYPVVLFSVSTPQLHDTWVIHALGLTRGPAQHQLKQQPCA